MKFIIACVAFFASSAAVNQLVVRKIIGCLPHLAAEEMTIRLMAGEIELMRRRVNALEYMMLPNLVETIRYISMKLDEQDRSTLSRLMKIKEIVSA